MISINLTPSEEVENKLWFLPEVTFLVVMLGLTWSLTQYYLGSIEDDIRNIKDQEISFNQSRERLKPDLLRYDEIVKQLDNLQEKIDSLKKITVSKTTRYKPIVILEQLQNLRPEGVWFNDLRDDTKKSVIEISGGAFDNLLIAEFMSLLADTKHQEFDPSDVRTQIFFREIHLGKVSSGVKTQNINSKENKNSNEAQRAFESTQDKSILGENQKSSAAQSVFPEISDFPKFSLKVKYDERGAISKADPVKPADEAKKKSL